MSFTPFGFLMCFKAYFDRVKIKLAYIISLLGGNKTTLCLHSEGRESRSHLGLETKGTKTLGLVLNFGTCLVSVSSRMKFLGQSRPGLVSLV